MQSNWLTNSLLTPGSVQQACAAFGVIQRRIEWMEQRGIEQWPRKHYLRLFNRAYFEQAARKKQLWLLKWENTVLACAVVLDQDDRWQKKPFVPAYYIHNFASLPEYPGAGGRLLALLEAKALQDGKTCLRLDCKTGSAPLNRYYRRRGYAFAGYFRSAVYNGNLRQKNLSLAD